MALHLDAAHNGGLRAEGTSCASTSASQRRDAAATPRPPDARAGGGRRRWSQHGRRHRSRRRLEEREAVSDAGGRGARDAGAERAAVLGRAPGSRRARRVRRTPAPRLRRRSRSSPRRRRAATGATRQLAPAGQGRPDRGGLAADDEVRGGRRDRRAVARPLRARHRRVAGRQPSRRLACRRSVAELARLLVRRGDATRAPQRRRGLLILSRKMPPAVGAPPAEAAGKSARRSAWPASSPRRGFGQPGVRRRSSASRWTDDGSLCRSALRRSTNEPARRQMARRSRARHHRPRGRTPTTRRVPADAQLP